MRFADRYQAGKRVADALAKLNLVDPVIIGLPRGGVPVAFEVARALNARLDVLSVRKLGAPGHPEYGIGAVAEDDAGVINTGEVERIGVSETQLQEIVARERAVIERRIRDVRGVHPAVDVTNQTVVVVDDGLATGVTATLAVRVLRQRGARKIILAIPVGAGSSIERLTQEVEQVICLHEPKGFTAVGAWYDDFQPTTDDEVLDLLARSRANES